MVGLVVAEQKIDLDPLEGSLIEELLRGVAATFVEFDRVAGEPGEDVVARRRARR